MEAAALMAINLAYGGVRREHNRCFSEGDGPDLLDFVGILCLLVLNSTISFTEENNAGNAAAALMVHLAPTTKPGLTHKKDYGKEDRAAKCVLYQRSLQGLMAAELGNNGRRSSLTAEQARLHAEIARLGELHTLRGHVESVVRL